MLVVKHILLLVLVRVLEPSSSKVLGGSVLRIQTVNFNELVLLKRRGVGGNTGYYLCFRSYY